MSEAGPRGSGLDMDTIYYYLISRAFFLLGLIPLRISYRLANALGRVWFGVDRRHREVAIANLHQAFGDQMTPAQIRVLARRVFCNLVGIIFEIGWSMHLKDANIRKYFRFCGMENLRAAMDRKKGVLILTGHIGNWELLLSSAGRIGLPISAIYRPLEFRPLDRFFNEMRTRDGAELFPKKRAMRKVLRSLKSNKIVGVLLDQNTGVLDGVFADFFGAPACTNKGLALLARETGAPVLPLFLVRERDCFRVEFGRELPHIKTRDKTKDIEAATSLYNKVLEDIIRRHPEQWFWVHRRWKTKPYKRWNPVTGDQITERDES